MERTEHGRVARLVIAGATAGLISLTVAAFDSDGVVYTSPGAPGHGASAGAIALEPSGSFYVSGKSTDNVDPTQQRFHIRRYTANGGLNPAFEVNLQHSGSLSVARRALLAHPDGGVVAALTLANANSPQDSYTRIVRYSDNGANTAAFADFEFDNSLRYDQLDVLAMQNDGKILAAGASAGALQTGGSAVVARINVDGSIDTSFSADGYVRVEPNLVSPTFAQRSYAAISFTSVNLLEDGRIFLAGTASDTSSNDSEMLFWRLLPDGSPDTSFNGGAPLLFAVRDGNNAGAANTVGGADVAPDGTFLIGGRSTAGGTGRAWLLLFSPDGTLLSSQNESFGFDQLFDVQLLPNGGVVAVGTYALSPAQPLVAVFSDGLQFSGLFFDPLGSSRTNALYATAYDPNEQRLLSVGLGVAEAPAPILAQWLVLATPIVSNDLDVSPEPFSFTLQSNVTPGTIVESEIVEISGVDEFVRIPARVFNGEATVQGRDFSDPSLTPPYYGVLRYVTPSGNPPALSAQLRHTAADGIANTERITALTAGGVVRSTNLALTVGATQTGQMKSVTEPTANPAGKIAFTTVSTGQVEGTTAILVVQRFVGDIGAVGVSYAITDDAGGAVVASGTLDWADADSSPRYVELPTIDDAIVQGPRNYTATLSTPTGGATLVNPFVATITIQDNDTPPTPGPTAVPTAMPTSAPTPTPLPTATPTPTPTVAPTPSPEPTPSATPIPKPGSARVTDADTSVREGQPARFTVRRVGGSSGAVSVHYAVLPGTAVPVTDYQDRSGTLRWADGDADPRVITIGTVDNLAADGVRTFEFRLSDAAGGLALGSPVSVITTITDDDFAAEPVTRFELSLTDGRIVSVTTSDGSLANVRTVPAPGGLPADFDYPIDFIGFDIERLAPGATVEVTLLLPEGVDADAYVKCGDEGCAPFAGATIAGRSVTLSLTDGGDGDGDGAANGTIRDPGTPARALDAPARSSGGGALSGALLAGLLLPVLWRRASGTLASLQT